MERELELFLNDLLKEIIPLTREAHIAYFNASISGKQEDYQKASRLELKLSKIYSNKKTFAGIKRFKNSKSINDQFLKRQIELLYNEFLSNQIDEKLIEKIIILSTKVEEKFATYRASVNGKNLTDNEIDLVLETSLDSDELEKTWKASKDIADTIVDNVLTLVKLRNEGAKSLGFNNYHEMSLALNEQNIDDMLKLFDDLDNLTSKEFLSLKEEIDTFLSKRYGIAKGKLMPWHYQDKFFQQGPKIYNVDLDKYFENFDVVELTRKYYNGINLNIDDLIEKSDLYEKEGKYQHAYCTDIDRSGDIRVVCNVKPNYKWMGTLLHEFGHAVYDKFINPKLPWLLRSHAHIFTTEAVAMLFGRFAADPAWLYDVAGVNKEEIKKNSDDCFNSLKLEQITFSRWVQVVFRFEKELYSNPDQDLNKLWWELVEKYQGIKKPEGRNKPDWASKIHIALYPAYYHNYILGELLASQLYFYIKDKVLGLSKSTFESFANKKEVGNYLKNLFFSYGAVYPWNELIEKSTGEPLTPKYYAAQFVQNKE
ncbi:peptidase family M3 [bacterium BMS3Abin04]|nr:peptidase family M3 [bacterium BMS3Abin04]